MYSFVSGSDNWNADVETVLRMFEKNFNEILSQSEYSVERNGTTGEEMVNLMRKDMKTRVGYIVPKRREQLVDFGLQIDLVARVKRQLDLPQETELKPGRYPGWRAFRKIPYEKAIEILRVLGR